MRGPIDYILVGFDGDKFTGEIIGELQKAVASGTIAVLALSVIAKSEDGTITMVDMDEEDLKVLSVFQLDNSLIDTDDVAEVGDILENGTAAGLLVIEHLWAKGLKQAIVNAGGTLIADGRIHPDASKELEKEDK